MKWSIALVTTLAVGCGGSASPASPATPSVAVVASPPAPAPSLWRKATAPSGASTGPEWVAIDAFDGKTIVTAVQQPAGSGPSPLVIFLHPDGGLHQRHLDFAASLAKEGFFTVTPCWKFFGDLPGDPPLGCAAQAPDRNAAADQVKDVMAVVAAAKTLPGVRPDRVVLVGHSAGAIAGIFVASMGGKVDGVVAISGGYGTAIKQTLGTTVPEQVDGLAVPLMIVHGTNDTNTPGTAVAMARAYEKLALDKGKSVESLYVEGAPHTLPYLATYWTDDVRSKVFAFIRKRFGT